MIIQRRLLLDLRSKWSAVGNSYAVPSPSPRIMVLESKADTGYWITGSPGSARDLHMTKTTGEGRSPQARRRRNGTRLGYYMVVHGPGVLDLSQDLARLSTLSAVR